MEKINHIYTGQYSELYDLLYVEKPYQEEVDFLHQSILNYGITPVTSILELACGTGNHALLLEKYGYSITATDLSEDMLTRAREKGVANKSSTKFISQDMRSLDLAQRPFDVIICLFDSLGYVWENAGLLKVFHGVNEHLKVGGLFIFDFWHAGAMLKSYDPVRVRHIKTKTGEIIRIAETELDLTRQVAVVDYTLFSKDEKGIWLSHHEKHTNRFFLLQEMNMWLKISGFEPVKWLNGFSHDEKITESTWHVLAIASKTG